MMVNLPLKPQTEAPMATKMSPRPRGFLASAFRRVGWAAKTSLALVGLVAILPTANDYYQFLQDEQMKKKKKKSVLVLPFYRMRIVERKKPSPRDLISVFQSDDLSTPIEVEVAELVDLIHEAAVDPEIVALYGQFGNGMDSSLKVQGRAQLEEIRNAIRVFNQIHRVHSNPNVNCDPNFEKPKQRDMKTTMAFADSFNAAGENVNYFLASEFQYICMQNQGMLDLFGGSNTTMFFRGALDKYGIKVHAFKQGQYKNFANIFTHKKFDKAHLEATRSLVDSLSDNVRFAIHDSRLGNKVSKDIWKAIWDYGTLTASNAKELSFIDAEYPIDPLNDLVAANNSPTGEDLETKWGARFNFPANHELSITQYKRIVDMRRRFQKNNTWLNRQLNKSGKIENLAGAASIKNEKIAVIYLEDGITSKVALKVVESLRKIKRDPDVKTVILRVNSPGGSSFASERILMECADLPQPVLCSMGNYAASGGYYVASNCHRIFASPSTITGSIGVFAIKLDLTDLASRYGISVQHVVTGSHSTMYDPFQPLTKKTSETLSRNVGQCYDWFKTVVCIGRQMTMQDVEKIGQGRVWTGIQALENGLVDDIGGLDRAIRYAQRNFTISGAASVEVWPKQKAPFSLLSELSTDTRYLGATLLENYSGRSKDKPYSLDLLSPAGREWLLKTAFDRFDFFPGTMMTID